LRRRRGILLVSGLAAGACVLALPAAMVPVVVSRAEGAAGGRPYCIEIADASSGYRAAASLLDLTGYRMRARRSGRGGHTVFHAVLFAERPAARTASWGAPAYERFNWSYRRLRFVPVAGQGHAGLGERPHCAPRHGFVGALPLAW
jgi:hypothetical protein